MPRIVPESYHHAGIVFDVGIVDRAEEQMADEILEKDDEDLLMIGLLTGGANILQGLIRVIGTKDRTFNPEYEYMRTGNYGSGTEAKGPRIYGDLPPHVEIEGRRVALVDDIFDSGASSDLAENHVRDLGAVEVVRFSLIYRSVKIENGEVIDNPKPKPEVCGLEYHDIWWLVGRGLNGPDTSPGGGRAFPFIARCAYQPDEVISLRG